MVSEQGIIRAKEINRATRRRHARRLILEGPVMNKCVVCVVMFMLTWAACANGRSQFNPWQPMQFQPKAAPNNSAGVLAQSSALRQRVARTADKRAIEETQERIRQQMTAIKELATKLEKTTEDSIIQGGSLRQEMEKGKVEKHEIDSVMNGLKEAAANMREAGKAVNAEIEKGLKTK